jgi:polysaccharide export outer membrane protein
MRALFGLVLWGVATLSVAQPSDAEPYRLQPEDVLRIQVYNQQQLQTEAPVGPDGSIQVAGAGSVRAQGLTTNELEAEIASMLRRRIGLREPIVTVIILRYRELAASIGGFVSRPSNIRFRRGDRILDLLAQGGGPREGADLRRATLIRRDNPREKIPIDLFAMLNQTDTSQNYVLEDGDQLYIPEEVNLAVSIQGKVQQPGRYPYREPMLLSDALSLARGEVVGRSRLSKVLVIRQRIGQPGMYDRINVDYVRFIRAGDYTQNIALQPGDLIWVPETNTPDFNYINAIANFAFILDRIGGGLFGIPIFRQN